MKVIALCGDQGVGKTSILKDLIDNLLAGNPQNEKQGRRIEKTHNLVNL